MSGNPFKFNTTGLSVGLVMPVHRDLPWQVVQSLIETQVIFQAHGIPLKIQMQVGSSIIEAARSRAVNGFLQTDATRLFWVDSDIAWAPDDFLKMALLSTKMDVVAAAYCTKSDDQQFALAGFNSDQSNEFGCLDCKGLGLGFTIVHRKIMEELAAKAPKLKFPDIKEPIPHIFRCDTTTSNEFRGEDIAFFSDVIALGYKVWLDPTIKLRHIGNKAYSARLIDIMQTEPAVPQPTMPNP